MTLSAIRAALAELGMQPTRSLGQNFLHDQNLAASLVARLDIAPQDAWIEIGPGLGALTEFAQARSPRGLLIEKDDRLIGYLRDRFPALEVFHGDAAEFDVRDLFPRGPVKVLGNLPYYVSSQILFHFTAEPSPVVACLFTLQRELAERLCGVPGTKEYGALTLLIGRRWSVKAVRSLPPGVFTPVPQVDSAAVLLTPRDPEQLPACDGARFERLVKAGFSQRRKQLRKLIGGEIADWPAAASQLGVSETSRAEELSLAQWIELTNIAGTPTRGGADAGAELAGHLLGQDVHGEIFDVVDENDRPVGTATRHEVHTRKLLHRAVHIFVFNRAGELFLQRRSRWKDMHPGRWDSSAAGHVNSGDSYDETAPRELLEELGVAATLTLLAAIPACAETGWEFVRIFRADHEGPFVLPPAEIETGGWFSVLQIERWIAARPEDFATGFLKCWQQWREADSQ